MQFAQRMSRVVASPTLRVAAEADRLRRQGVDVVDLGAGEPDFTTPEHVKDAAHAALDNNFTKYTPSAGVIELREAVAQRYRLDYGVEIKPDEVIITAGGKQALYNTAMALFEQGDEVITHGPFWPSICDQIKLADARPVIVQTHREEGFVIRASAIIAAITPRTKAIIVNSPCNPTGALITEEEMAAIADAAAARGLWVIADLTYERLIYDPVAHNLVKVLFDRMRDRTVICSAASKAYAMTGWRCGWAIGPKELITQCNVVQGHSTSNINSITQKAGIAALTGPQDGVTTMLDEYRKRRDAVHGWLTADPRFQCVKPGGAFYLFPYVADLLSPTGIKSTGELAEMMLQEVAVAVTPGEGFDAPGFFRLSYATSIERLKEGVARMQAFVATMEKAGKISGVTIFMLVSVLVLQGSSASAAHQPATAGRPNVVLVITDDVGYGDIGSYGSPDIKTPQIDRLAKAGVRLTDFYAAPQCTPTRAALISGRYQQRVKMERAMGNVGAALEAGLTVTGRSLPQLLKNNGYRTGLVGKWHLGFKPEFGPNAHGFDDFFGFLSGYIDFYTHTRGGDGASDLFENTTPIREDGYMTDLITARALRFIEQRATEPFFLEVAYNAAHWPFQPPDHYSKAANNGAFQGPDGAVPATRKDYAAMLERADAGVGQIVQKLAALGLTQNTLVIFTNDNGGEWLSRNAPLFHRKDTLWEGGIRVPTIFRWPGRIPAGKTSAQTGITMDLTASILAATNTPVPVEARPDGINLLPILEGRAPVMERTLFWRINVELRQQRAVRSGDWKLLIDGDDLLLFNLKADIGERNDLAAARPDLVAKLRPLIAAWEKDVDSEATSIK